MSTKCWLFPFTHGVDARAIERVVQLAASADAALCSVALLPVSPRVAEERAENVRLEHVMQANDFFEVVRHKAMQRQVEVECRKVSTSNVAQSVTQLAEELQCSSVVVMLNGQQGALLETSAVRELLLSPTVPLMLVRPLELTPRSRTGLRAWFQQRLGQRTHVSEASQTSPELEKVTTV